MNNYLIAIGDPQSGFDYITNDNGQPFTSETEAQTWVTKNVENNPKFTELVPSYSIVSTQDGASFLQQLESGNGVREMALAGSRSHSGSIANEDDEDEDGAE